MIKIIEFKKRKVVLGIIFFAIYLAIVLYFVFNPEGMMAHLHSKNKQLVQIPFLIASIFPFFMLYSFFRILFRKKAIIITKEYLIDNSRYEALGKIKWKDITKIKKLKKRSIQIYLNPTTVKTSLSKTFIRFLTNWEYKDSIIISDALIDCSRDELYKIIKKEIYKENIKDT